MARNRADLPQPTSWTLPGAAGQAILGNTHIPALSGEARGVVLILHGFLGYKDYGMFPRIAERFAEAGFIAHRFNFSHSGMTEEIATFARPELFADDTWSRQVFDVNAVRSAVVEGRLPGAGRPMLLLGHSRGGVTAMLTAGRQATGREGTDLPLNGLVTIAAPDTTCRLTPEQQEEMLSRGFLEVASSRTGQVLRINADWLREQHRDPDGHDLDALIAAVRLPMLIVHGSADPTVHPRCAEQIAAAAGPGAVLRFIAAADHVFNTPNPFPADAPESPQLSDLISTVLTFCRRTCQ